MSDQEKKPSVDDILNELRQKRKMQLAELSKESSLGDLKPPEPERKRGSESSYDPQPSVIQEENIPAPKPPVTKEPERASAPKIPVWSEPEPKHKSESDLGKGYSDIEDNQASRSFIESYFSSSQKGKDYLKSFYNTATEAVKKEGTDAPAKEETAEEKALVPEVEPPEPSALETPPPSEDPYDTKSIRAQRLGKIRDFVLSSDEEEEDDDQEELEKETTEEDEEELLDYEITEYRSAEEADSIKADIGAVFSKLLVRFAALLLPSLLALYMTFAPALSLPLPDTLNPSAQSSPVIYAFVSLILLLFSAFVSLSTMTEGLADFLKLKANNDSYAAVCVVVALLHNCFSFLNLAAVSAGQIHLFSSIAILALLINTLGKLAMVSRVRHNFHFINAGEDKYGNILINNPDITGPIADTTGYPVSVICVQREAPFVSRFLEHSYSPDPSDRLARVLCTLLFVGAAAVGGVVYFLTKSGLTAFTSFSAAVCISFPLTGMLTSNLPLLSENKRLARWGAMISGYSSLSEMEKTDAVVLKDTDLLPDSSATIHGIKTFGSRPIDQTIIYTISAMHSLKNSLESVFMQIIEDKKELLKEVETISYTDEGGIEAWVAAHRVHIGRREQFSRHDIEVPSRDFEEKYCKKGRQAFYIAVNSEICAMVVVSYRPRKDIALALKRLIKLGVTALVDTTDPNLTDTMLSELFELKEGQIDILPTSVKEAVSREEWEPDSRVVHRGSFKSFAWAVTRAIKLKWNIDVGTVIQTIGSVAGFVLAGVLSVLMGVGQLDAAAVLLYQLSWLALIVTVQKIL